MNPAEKIKARTHTTVTPWPGSREGSIRPMVVESTPGEGKVTPIDEQAATLSIDDFFAYMPTHSYLFVPTRELWPAASVNARVAPVSDPNGNRTNATLYLDKYRTVEQMIWAPGKALILENTIVANGEFIQRAGCHCFNLYIPSVASNGNPAGAQRWIDLVQRLYPGDAEHLIRWFAHRVQNPDKKVNHAIVLGGQQGIGKDTILEPVKHAVGPWNFSEVSPENLTGRFNGFVKSVILRVSEARDLGDSDRYRFYDHMKIYTASPPDVLRCDEKNLREHAVMNVCGVIITTNYKTDGIYLPADDRRHYVAWSSLSKEDFADDYWMELYRWYANGGLSDVAAYLAALDLSAFDSKAPPPKTSAFWGIVDANRAPEDSELADALDSLGNPEAITLSMIVETIIDQDFREWLHDRRNRRQIPHRLEAVGYVPVRNEADKRDGLWKVADKRQTIYARKEMPECGRIAAARDLANGERRWKR